jgi:YbbR domain-containing protein
MKEQSGKKKKKNKIGWTKLFYNNKFAVCFSVVLTVILWAVLVSNDTQDRPTALAGVPVKITLSSTMQADGLKIFNQSDKTATVYVKGNSLTVGQMKPTDLVAIAPSAASITTPGTYPLMLQVQNADDNINGNGYTVNSISPQQVIVTVDRYQEKTFNVQDDITYKSGYQSDSSYFVGAPAHSSDTVTISGPEKQVSQVSRVAYEYEVNDTLKDTKKFTAALVMYDANGNKVEKGDMTVNPEKIDVTIPVMPRKTLKLNATFANKPAGLSLSANQVQISPENIDIAGSQDVLTTLAGKFNLDPIDFSSISPTHNTFDANISLPATCKNLSNIPTAKVTLNLTNMATKQATVSSFNVKNLPANENASVDTTSLKVMAVGPQDEISSLNDSSVIGSVDLSSKENFTGKTEMPVKFTVSSSSGCWVYGSYMVTVNVTKKGQ